jgi:hypothetical protein
MFNNVIYGNYGDEKATSSTKIGNLPLGTLMILPNGSQFRHSKASATAMVAGKLYQQNSMADVAGSADVAFDGTLAVAASVAVGATTVTVTLGGTAAITKDALAGGQLFVSLSSGAGHVYRIKGNTAAGSVSVASIYLEDTDPIKVALAASSTKVGVRQNPYDNLTITTADTVAVGAVAGIAPVAVPASYYCWIQRSGECAAFTDNTTLIVGIGITASTTVAGAVAVKPAASASITSAKGDTVIGRCLSVAASAYFSHVSLFLE